LAWGGSAPSGKTQAENEESRATRRRGALGKRKKRALGLWRRKSGDEAIATGTLAPHRENQPGPGLSAREKETEALTGKRGISSRRKIRPAAPTNHLDQDQSQEHTKEILRFGTNTNKMQTRNISLRTEPNLHPIHGGLRPPSLF
jgi:hypothetical protein